MDTENLTRQIEEVEALSSIYNKDWIVESKVSRSYRIKIGASETEVLLYVRMCDGYPSKDPPTYELSAPWMNRKIKEKLHCSLNEIYLKNVGETVIYQWVEFIRELLHKMKAKDTKPAQQKRSKNMENGLGLSQFDTKCPAITHAEVITDRKSSFQGHAAEVHSISDVNAVLAKLKENKKILNATHNMYAYRIERKTKQGATILQNSDNDGENQAGGRMLHLLEVLEQKNTLIVVTRWYGGIQLGPGRFRHINNTSRQAIQLAGLLKK